MPYTERASNNGINYTITENGIKVKGTTSASSYSWGTTYASYSASLIKLPAGTYTFSSSAIPTNSQVTSYLVFMGFTESEIAITNIVISGTTLSKTATFSEPVGIYYGFYVASGQSVDCDCKIMIESGSSKTDFAPYSNICPITGWTGANIYVSPTDDPADGRTYSVTFPNEAGTVYSGTLDVTSGVLTVTHAWFEKNTATMDNSENYPGWKACGIRNIIGANNNKGIRNIVGNIATEFSANTMNQNDILFLSISDFGKTQTEWIALAQDVQFVIPLTIPVTYQLTPVEINLLLEENYIYTDVNNIDLLKYKGYK